MKKSLINSLKFIIFSGIAASMLYVAFKDIDLHSLWTNITQAHFGWVALALACSIAGLISRTIRWNYIIEPLRYKPLFRNSFWALCFGYFANFAFPRLGEVARCGALNRTEKIPVDKLLGTVIVERVFDMLMLLILAGITIIIKIDFFGDFIANQILIPSSRAFGTINFYALFFVFFICAALIVFFFVTSKKNILSRKIISFLKGMLQGIKAIYHLQHRKQFILHTLFIWSMYWAMTWIICFAIEETASLNAIDGLFLLVVGGIGMAVPVQSGIGVFHFIVGQAIAIYGFDYHTTGILYATLSHGSQTIMLLIMGVIASYSIFYKHSPSKL